MDSKIKDATFTSSNNKDMELTTFANTNPLIARRDSLVSRIAYHKENISPYYSEMEAWERKEYDGVLNDNETELRRIETYMAENNL